MRKTLIALSETDVKGRLWTIEWVSWKNFWHIFTLKHPDYSKLSWKLYSWKPWPLKRK